MAKNSKSVSDVLTYWAPKKRSFWEWLNPFNWFKSEGEELKSESIIVTKYDIVKTIEGFTPQAIKDFKQDFSSIEKQIQSEINTVKSVALEKINGINDLLTKSLDELEQMTRNEDKLKKDVESQKEKLQFTSDIITEVARILEV
jgi:hypothetical protein